jgi:hypothetical protein
MAGKRPSLTDTMKAVQGERQAVRLIHDPESVSNTPREATFRAGKKRAMAPLSVEDHRRLKRLSADTDKTIEELMVEAVNDLLIKHGM